MSSSWRKPTEKYLAFKVIGMLAYGVIGCAVGGLEFWMIYSILSKLK